VCRERERGGEIISSTIGFTETKKHSPNLLLTFLQDGLDHFGNEYKGDDKVKQISKFSSFVEYMKALPGIKIKE